MAGLEKDVLAVWRGGTAFALTGASGHTALTDGDARQAMSPMELLLGSLVGCAAADVITILQKKRQAVSSLEARVRGLRCEEHPRIYTDITVHFTVTGQQIDPEAVRRAIELTETKYCSVSAMLAERSRLAFDFEIREAAVAAAPAEPDPAA
jgi:putative redox protein